MQNFGTYPILGVPLDALQTLNQAAFMLCDELTIDLIVEGDADTPTIHLGGLDQFPERLRACLRLAADHLHRAVDGIPDLTMRKWTDRNGENARIELVVKHWP